MTEETPYTITITNVDDQPAHFEAEDEQIKNNAGLAQLASDEDVVKFFKNKSNGNFGDNEGDASAIQDGIDSYKENNK